MVDHHDEHDVHITPVRTYLLAGLALLVLTLVTVGVAFVDLGPLNEIVALSVATAKALVIVLIFMHGRYATGVSRLAIVAGLIWFAILVVGILDDYLTRDWIMIPGK